MNPTASFVRFEASLHRCLADPTFIDRFYARFIGTNAEIAGKFEGVDLARQAKALRASLYLVLRAAAGHDDGITHLRDVGRSHGERKLGVRREHYAHWVDTLVTVAREMDRQFDASIESAWREHLAPCIEAIVSAGGTD